MAGLSYMQRRTSGIYEFRKRLPSELAGKPAPPRPPAFLTELINPTTGSFKRELTVSLRTHDVRQAKSKDLREAVRVTDLFALALRYMRGEAEEVVVEALSFPSPEEIEADTIARLLREDEVEREDGDARRQLQTAGDRSQWPDLEDARLGEKGMTEAHLEVMSEEIEMLSQDYRKALAGRNTSIVKAELHADLKGRQLPIDPSSSFYREAGLAVLRGHVKAYDLMARRQGGEDIKTPAPVIVDKGPKLSEALAYWRQGSSGRGGKQPSSQTVREAERAVGYFTRWHSDVRLGEITKALAREFRNALATLPTRLTAKQRKMPLKALLADRKDAAEPIHAATVNKYLTLLGAIVSASEKEGRLDGILGFTNPFQRLSLALDKRAEGSTREPFSKEQLENLFGHGVFHKAVRPLGGGGEAAFWFPLIALLSGARLNEIAQLRVKDLKHDTEAGTWVLDIGTDGGRAIKTVSSRRQVPVHKELIRLGLLSYREDRLKGLGKTGPNSGENATLWPDVTSEDPAYRSTGWSKWFNRFLRKTIRIEDKRIVFHSFRHTFKRMARDAGLAEELHDRLTGHSGGGVGRSYGAGFGLKALSEAIAKIEAPSSVTSLPEWQRSGGRKGTA